jgi:hypothetical protein
MKLPASYQPPLAVLDGRGEVLLCVSTLGGDRLVLYLRRVQLITSNIIADVSRSCELSPNAEKHIHDAGLTDADYITVVTSSALPSKTKLLLCDSPDEIMKAVSRATAEAHAPYPRWIPNDHAFEDQNYVAGEQGVVMRSPDAPR